VYVYVYVYVCVVVLLVAAGWWFCRGPLVRSVYLGVCEYLSVYVFV
jgi:hypothetical protein